jgi:serine protease Do
MTEMKSSSSRQFVTFLVVLAAVAFGMVLASGFGLTVPGMADDSPGPQMVSGNATTAGGLPSFADLAEAVAPAVVSIRADSFESAPAQRRVDPFEFFFGPRRRQQPQEEEQQPESRRFRQESGGSGFVISADGLIATNNHVVEDADRLVVTLQDRDYEATVVGTDPATDLALIKIDAGRSLKYLKLGDSDHLRVGDWIMAIGSPLRLDHTVTVGVVSAKGRSIGITPEFSLENFIQTDAAINFGNSGGPLVNLRGEVVGIATAINYGAENIGFAVPVSTLQQVLPQLRDEGKVTRGYLGVNIGNLTFELAQSFGIDGTDGAVVQDALDDQPAAEAGIRAGDIILRIDDVEVTDTRDLIDYVSAQKPGDKVNLHIWRDGKEQDVSVKLGERPGTEERMAEASTEGSGGDIDWLGIRYQELTQSLREDHGMPESARGVWLTAVDADSPLYDVGVRVGDVIAEVNGQSVESSSEFETLINDVPAGAYLRLYVQRYDPRTESWTSFFAPVRKP